MKLYTPRPNDDDDAADEPLLVERDWEKIGEAVRLGARPKKYRHVRDADACIVAMQIDACLSALRSLHEGVMVAAMPLDHELSPDVRVERQRLVAKVQVIVRATLVVLTGLDNELAVLTGLDNERGEQP